MRLLSRVFKNYQINVGTPIQLITDLKLDVDEKISESEIGEKDNLEVSTDNQLLFDEIIQNAKNQAEKIVEDAKFEANKIIEDAKDIANKESEIIMKNVKEQAYNEAKIEAEIKAKELTNEAEAYLEKTKSEYKEMLLKFEPKMINMILSIAKKVIGDEITDNKESVVSLVSQAIEKCSDKESVLLKVSSDDYDFLCINKDKILEIVGGIGELSIKKDPSLKAGSCIVETVYGYVDAGIETQIKEIERVFKQLVKIENEKNK